MNRLRVSRRLTTHVASSILILLIFEFILMISTIVQDVTTAHAYLATPTSVPGTSIVDSTFLTPTSVPGTPTSTLTELQKVQLIQQIDQQQHTFQNWLWNLFTSSLATLAVLAGGLFAFFRW